MGTIPPILITKICCFLWHVVLSRGSCRDAVVQLAPCAQAVRLMGTWSAAVAMVVVYINDPLVDWPAYTWWLGIMAVATWPVLAPTGSAGGSTKGSGGTSNVLNPTAEMEFTEYALSSRCVAWRCSKQTLARETALARLVPGIERVLARFCRLNASSDG